MELVFGLFLCLLGAGTGVKNEINRTIWCTNSDIRKRPSLLKGIKQDDMICEANETDDYPFTNDKQDTPPGPRNMALKVKTFRTREGNGSLHIAIYATWEYKVQYLDAVKSYHLELIQFKPSYYPSQYIMKWDRNKTTSFDGTSALIQFGFIYFGKPGNHIRPEAEFTFKIQACPIYHEDKEPQVESKDITIPSCADRQISKTKICINQKNAGKERLRERGKIKRKEKKKKDLNDPPVTGTAAPPSLQEDIGQMLTIGYLKRRLELDPLTMILLSFGASVVIVILTFTAWCRRKRIYSCFGKKVKSAAAQRGVKNVLFVCSSDARFLKPMNQFINLFTKFDHMEVICDLRQSNEIGELGIPEWMKRNIRNADVVAFIIANSQDIEPSEQDSDDSGTGQVSLGLKASERMIFNNKSEFGRKNFIVIDFTNCTKKEDFPYFPRYKFPRDFEKFVKLLIGDISLINADEKEIFIHLLHLAKLEARKYDCENHTQEPEVHVEVENFNNLSDPPQLSLKSNPEQEDHQNNIFDSLPPSVECNQSGHYSTTDFNDNQAEQYRRAGARPKTRC